MSRIAVALVVFVLAVPAIAATRLPVTVIPDHYAISISPDLAAETFNGTETIDANVTEPVDSVTMHAVDLVLKDVTISSGGKDLPATVTADAPNDTVTFKVAQTLAPGPIAIHVSFDGKLLPQLRGLYLSKTAKRKYAVTQFEAMSARRAFPCFDEPAMKATFDITLVVDRGDTAISNGEIVSDTPSDGKHAIRFATTKKMSTYLVAMLVGDFECIKGGAGGTPIRVCATPGLQPLGQFALHTAEASIDFFNNYYGINYPFGKLDLIGIPDFAAGAMENAGAITFRETDLLVDEKSSSVLAQKRVAEVVAHEIAHQWFGDLVTMKWWNDIWLNEGFATFMSQKPIEAWKPEWREDLDKPAMTDVALVVDSQLSTRPIRTKDAVDGGGAAFDSAITYDKTAAVLRMVEDWIGPDQFRDAIRTYLKKYSWSNAAAEDFWASMKASSNQPIDAVLESFIDLTGAPLLHVSDTCDASGRQVTIAQERMLPQGASAPAETWMMPICVRDGACRVIDQPSQTFASSIPCKQPLFVSHNGAGYFLTDYSAGERKSLVTHLSDLSPKERISYHGDEWLLSRFNRRDLGDYLGLLRAMPRNPVERPMITAISDNLIFLDQRLVNDRNRAAWQRFVRSVLRGYAPFTWETPAGETSEQRIDRAYVLWALGYAGDRDVIAGARKVAAKYIADPSSVDALIADRALRLSAVYGDEAFFNRVVEQLAKASSPETANRYRSLVPLFREPKLTKRALAYIYGDQVRTQDLPLVAAAMFSDPSTRSAAWAEAKSRWADTAKRSISTLVRIVGATSTFCDPESKKDVETFVAAIGTRTSPRTLSRALESIDTCIAFRNMQQDAFDRAIASK